MNVLRPSYDVPALTVGGIAMPAGTMSAKLAVNMVIENLEEFAESNKVAPSLCTADYDIPFLGAPSTSFASYN